MIYISEGFTFSAKHSAGMNCSMSLNSPRNYRFFFSVQMVRALGLRMTCKDLQFGHEIGMKSIKMQIYICWRSKSTFYGRHLDFSCST